MGSFPLVSAAFVVLLLGQHGPPAHCPTPEELKAAEAAVLAADKVVRDEKPPYSAESSLRAGSASVALQNLRIDDLQCQVAKREAETAARHKTEREAFQAAEKKKAPEQMAEAEDFVDHVNAIERDPKVVRLVLSAGYCFWNDRRKSGLAAIDAERKASKIGAVVDMKLLHDAQDQVVAGQRRTKEVAARLKAAKLKRLPCWDTAVDAVKTCMGPDGARTCSTPEERALQAALDDLLPGDD